jgi:GAF domain-containing protein
MFNIQISGQVVGHITAHKSAEQSTWLPDEIALMETLSNQLGVALDSARLYLETQQRAAREQLTGEVTTRIRETLDIETILRTASDEIRKALNLPEVVIRLGEPSSEQAGGATE